MNLFQAANGAATFLIFSALVAGMARHFEAAKAEPFEEIAAHREMLLLGLFIVVFRIKTLIDDHRHFAEVVQDKLMARYIGFILAAGSWIFWGFAAYLLPYTIRSAKMMGTSLLISTAWIVVHVYEIMIDRERRNKEVITSLMREKWVMINLFYMTCLVAFVGWFEPVVQPGNDLPLYLLLGMLVLDIFSSRPVIQ